MPPRVTYWTGTWEPEKEAISKEIASLRTGDRARAPLVSFSPVNRTSVCLGHRTLRLSAHRWLTLRATAALVERLGDVSHAFGGFESWHLLRALGRRPLLLTAVSGRADASAALPRAPGIVAVEAEALADPWVRAGVPADRVRLVYPGVDLEWFSPVPLPDSPRLTVLFASSPDRVDELEPRGVRLLIELARLRPDIDILVPWRQWGSVDTIRAALDRWSPPPNFHIRHEDAVDMRTWYAAAHGVILPFQRGIGKACPNSVVEGLAMGRPAVVTPGCTIGRMLESVGAAVVAERSVEALSSALDRFRRELPVLATHARETAVRFFGLTQFKRTYDALYEELLLPDDPLSTR